jgi:hypothetical protein
VLRFWSRLPPFISIMISFLLGCVQGGAQSVTAETSSPVILPANTSVILRLTKPLHKKDGKPEQPAEFEVGYDVFVNGQIFIQNGAAVTGSVRQVDHTGRGPARVIIDLGPAQTISGEMVRLRWTRTATASNQPVSPTPSLGAPRLGRFCPCL